MRVGGLVLLFVSLLSVSLTPLAAALPLYADAANASFALVLCRGLDSAVSALRQRELAEHAIGAEWLEQDCVSIDPCAQVSSNTDSSQARLAAPAGVWLHGNGSALRLARSGDGVGAAESGVRAHNYGRLEFARVPEGLRVQACAPDFDLWRRQGVVACDEDTLVSITADSESRACPGSRPHSLLDCMRSLEFDSSSTALLRRPGAYVPHFGTRSWDAVCGQPEALAGAAAQLCLDLAASAITVPVASAVGYTSLVRYELLPSYSCHDALSTSLGADEVLSRRAAPNRIVDCPHRPNGRAQRVDAFTCGTVCDAGFALAGDACLSRCLGLNASCEAGFFAVDACQEGARTLYNCSLCPNRAGFAALKATDDPFECRYSECVAGTQNVGLACHPCAVNTVANASRAMHCEGCDTLHSGLYQTQAGQTSCHECLWNTSGLESSGLETSGLESSGLGGLCPPATERALGFARVQHLFALYLADNVAELQPALSRICEQGYACLPCEPGHYEHARACLPCPHASYQPNFGASQCHACASGQNTSARASTRSSDCVCTAGFE